MLGCVRFYVHIRLKKSGLPFNKHPTIWSGAQLADPGLYIGIYCIYRKNDFCCYKMGWNYSNTTTLISLCSHLLKMHTRALQKWFWPASLKGSWKDKDRRLSVMWCIEQCHQYTEARICRQEPYWVLERDQHTVVIQREELVERSTAHRVALALGHWCVSDTAGVSVRNGSSELELWMKTLVVPFNLESLSQRQR